MKGSKKILRIARRKKAYDAYVSTQKGREEAGRREIRRPGSSKKS